MSTWKVRGQADQKPDPSSFEVPSGQGPHDSGLRRDEGLEREANESSLVPRTQMKCIEKNAGVTCCISHGNVHMKLEKYGGENSSYYKTTGGHVIKPFAPLQGLM